MNGPYTIRKYSLKRWRAVLDKVLYWNANKDVTLLVFNYNPTTSAGARRPYIIMHAFDTLFREDGGEARLAKWFKVKPIFLDPTGFGFSDQLITLAKSKENIWAVFEYIEKTPEDYLVVRRDNLKHYCRLADKPILSFELHSSITSNGEIVRPLELEVWDLLEANDYSKYARKGKVITFPGR